MRSNWLSSTLALIVPAAALLSACGPAETGTGGTGGTGGSTGGSTVSVGGSVGGSTGTAGSSTGGSTGTAGSSTGGSTGGTGGSGPPANDACPGTEVAIAIDTSTSISGSLTNAADDYTTFCADPPEAGADKPDVVYQLVVPAAATVSLTVTAEGFDPAISLRKFECDTRFATDACYNLGVGSGETKVLALDAGTYWVVVDTADGNVGPFTFDVDIASPACGDGAVNAGEQCDPVTVSNNDGCINPSKPNECQYGEPPQDTAVIECPGGTITPPKGMKQIFGPYNNGSGKSQSTNVPTDPNGDFTGPCPYDAFGPENVFNIIPNADGLLKVTIGHTEDGVTPYCSDPQNVCGDFVLYLRSASCDAGTQLTCDDYNEDPQNPEVLSVEAMVTAGTSYWLYVDSYQDDPQNPLTAYPGEYFLELDLQ